jgi:hypothetical protein
MNTELSISGKQWAKLGGLFFIFLIVSILSYFPATIERVYSTGFYPGYATVLRLLTKNIPFSIGDIAYLIAGVWLTVGFFRGMARLARFRFRKEILLFTAYHFARFVFWVYLVFKLVWGLNYYRIGIADRLHIQQNAYTTEEVTRLTNQLIDQLNQCRKAFPDSILPSPSLDSIYREAYRCYGNLSDQYAFLNYTNRSVKSSLFTGSADYFGFTGYYNPFSGEAQIRTDVPRILIPYIVCHEMAHQLGFASESEANFVGYLAASASKDVYFRYSVYLDLFSYAQGEEIRMYGKEKDFKAFESVIAQNRSRLDTLVKNDRKAIREFFYQRRNRISPAISSLYDQYLKMNKQYAGVNSYNDVVGWLIAYQKKYGKL